MAKKRIQNGDQPYKVTVYRKLCSVEEFSRVIDEQDDTYWFNNGMALQKITLDDFCIDTSLIPDHVRNDLAVATLEFIREVMQDPVTREKIKTGIGPKRMCNRNRNNNFKFKKDAFRIQRLAFRLYKAVFR